MKKTLFITIPVILISLFLGGYYLLNSEISPEVNEMSFPEHESGYTENNSYENENGEMESEENEEKSGKLRSSYNQKFEVPQELYNESMKKVMTAPSEEDFSDFVSTNFWTCIGPFGYEILESPGYSHTGRCNDYFYGSTIGTLLGTSQGGLWKAASTPICLTDNIPPLSISTFGVNVFNYNNIVIGTGDLTGSGSSMSYLSGVWVTTNAGANWVQAAYDQFPDHVYKIRYSGIGSLWYMSAQRGFYTSTNGGYNWTRIIPYSSTDFDFEFLNVYSTVVNNGVNNGVWKSTNAGANFTRLTGLDAVAPQGQMGDIRISIAQSLTSRIYVNITNEPTVGVYKTENSGSTWQNTNIPNHHYNQGLHNNAIAINPSNPDLILAGGGGIVRTTNNGSSWVGINSEYNFSSYHADITRIVWDSVGTGVTATSDGGFHRSSNGGLNWTSYGNNLPVAQFYNIDVAVRNNLLYVIGAAQDNSITLVKNATLNFPGIWNRYIGPGDGGDVCIIEDNPDYILASIWGSGDNINRTTNAGVVWSQIFSHATNNGVCLDDDRLGPGAWFYRSILNVVSYSQDLGANWQLVAGGGNFTSSVFNLSACRYTGGGSVVYITTSGGNRNIWVYDTFAGGGWLNRFSGLPDIQFGKVAVHPRNNTTAYALVATPNVTNKVFKTTNRGIQWADVSGDLQIVAGSGIMVRDLVPHPTNDNFLYIGTNFGCWRTTNAGVNWHRWNLAMPVGNDIRDMEFIDSVNANKFYVIAGTHGRGVWTRDAISDDPNAVNNNGIPVKYALYQNYPNPFNPSTTIKFELPVSDIVKITVYDIIGREISIIVNAKMEAGTHEIKFDASLLTSGVYFYRLETSRMIDVKKMILLK